MCFFCCCCCIGPIPCGFLDKIECDFFRSKLQAIHLLYIGASIFLFIFLLSTMSIIKWGKLPSINITLFIFLFLILVACIALSIIIIYWKSDEGRQREMKEKIQLLSKICLCLSITSIILYLLEIIILSVGFSKAKFYYPCFYDEDGNYTYSYSYSVKVYVGFFFFIQSNDNFKSNSTISEFVENEKENKSSIRILSSEEEEYLCYEQFLTSAVYGMTYFTFIISEIINIAAIFFFKELFKSEDSYNFRENQEPPGISNQNANAPNINIQAQQVIIINSQVNNSNNNGTNKLVNISHQTRGVQRLDKIDKSKFDKKNKENNLNQNKNSNYNIKNNQQKKEIDYPEKEEVINNNIPRNQITSGAYQEIRFGYQNNNNNNININNQTIDSKDDNNNIAFGSDRLVMK